VLKMAFQNLLGFLNLLVGRLLLLNVGLKILYLLVPKG
jgi:hypothetical protein